jgi:hypothetical protein
MIHIVASRSIQDHLHDINVMYFEPFLNTVCRKGYVMMILALG